MGPNPEREGDRTSCARLRLDGRKYWHAAARHSAATLAVWSALIIVTGK